MFLAILALVLLALATLLLNQHRFKFQRQPENPPTIQHWLASQRAIVTFAYAGPSIPLQQKLLLRSQPNSRLVAAFGINNSLTTTSVEVHERFRRTAARLLANNRLRWQLLYTAAEGVLSELIARRSGEMSCNGEGEGPGVGDEVEVMEGKGVEVEKRLEIEKEEEEDLVVVITREINSQWVLEEGLKRLQLVLPDGNGVPLTPEEALGLIMPQYETLWRVVLLTFVTAFHRSQGERRQEITRRAEGVPGCLGDSEKEKSALGLAKEGLRLFPSNKRIYRTGSEPADLERCHRRAEIWGADALEFRPERFDSLTDLQKQAYFPFSIGQHKCPAYAGFGDRMVTMLVVVLGRMLSAEVGVVVFNDEALDADGERLKPLPTGRDDMEGWVLELF
ncbi:hypothetical protein B0T19DRAFT_404024 [Cercophora scortea]|uniref:Cytochrome P450 n=1 Tax=Cercophora scortea TaxID=314031 RepID=A0AAE0M767_9PEZI|nr:hypothetical protein B0T19DRAFT_404024 [Cercophora scortea]